ncbi:hypothetical protein HUC00_08665 [Bacillus mycoides]|nr:hypothetical protein [Bacillus mycoides]
MQQTKKLTQSDIIIAVMSGPFCSVVSPHSSPNGIVPKWP